MMESDNEKTFIVRHHHDSAKNQAPSSDAELTFSVRIPASTLLEMNSSSELLLEPSSNEGEASSGMLRTSHADIDEEKLTVRAEHCSARIYAKNPENSVELLHVGDSSQILTIQPSKEVEVLGRKARERLEEERRKRREIVRLEQDPEERSSSSKKQGTIFAEAVRKQRPRLTSAMKRKHVEKFSDSFPDPPAGTVDTWTPSVSHISLCMEGERSSVIHLHGLPMSVKPEFIRRFFSGLDLERIFVVLTNRSRIPEWDERRHPSQLVVERREPSFRVYVKFVSSPVADIALARSEEFLYMDEQDTKIGVHIGMTKVSKSIANYLQNYMVCVLLLPCDIAIIMCYVCPLTFSLYRCFRLLTVSTDVRFTKHLLKRNPDLAKESQVFFGQWRREI